MLLEILPKARIRGGIFDVELIYLSKIFGSRRGVKEFGMPWIDNPGVSNFRIRDGLKMRRELKAKALSIRQAYLIKALFRNTVNFEEGDFAKVHERSGKRQEMLKGLTLEWAGQPTEEGIKKARHVIDDVVRDRLEWHKDKDITIQGKPATKESVFSDTLSMSVGFVLEELLKNACDAYVRAGNTGPIRFEVYEREEKILRSEKHTS